MYGHLAADHGAHPVKICLRVLREVEIDDDVDSLDVDASSEQICGNRRAPDHNEDTAQEETHCVN